MDKENLQLHVQQRITKELVKKKVYNICGISKACFDSDEGVCRGAFPSKCSNHFYSCNYVILCKDGACGNRGALLPKVNASLVIAAIPTPP